MKDISELKKRSIFFSLGILIAFIPTLIFWWHFSGDVSTQIEDWGNWGQYISGSVGVLLSALTIILVVKSINLQTKEFNLMIQNQKETTVLLTNQNFENTYFRLLELHYKVVESVVGIINKNQYFGRDYFYHFILEARERDKIDDKSFVLFINQCSEKFSHYKSNIIEIFNFIDRNHSVIDEEKYFNIFKAQLSNAELITLCYLGGEGKDHDLLKLLKKHNLISLIKQEDGIDLPKGVFPLAVSKYIQPYK